MRISPRGLRPSERWKRTIPIFPVWLVAPPISPESTGIPWIGCRPVDFEHPDGNLIYYGAREFAMYAIMNGLALHGGYVPFGGTFLMFADYGPQRHSACRR